TVRAAHRIPAPSLPGRACRSGDVSVDVGVLVDDGLHVGHVMLEAVAADGLEDAPRHLVRAELRTVVDGIVVLGLFPDLGVDGPWLDQLDRYPCAVQIDGHRFAPPPQREFACTLCGFVNDPQPAADTGYIDD